MSKSRTKSQPLSRIADKLKVEVAQMRAAGKLDGLRTWAARDYLEKLAKGQIKRETTPAA